MQRRKYSDDVKAEVMAALLAGQGVRTIAEERDIPRSTLRRWQQKANGQLGSQVQANADRIAGLIATYLEESLQTLTEQLRQFRDLDWIKKQGAAESSLLHGVLFDKAIRILEAVERARRDQDSEE